MLRQIEGSRPSPKRSPCAGPRWSAPIRSHTNHIIEALGAMVKSGSLTPCEFITSSPSSPRCPSRSARRRPVRAPTRRRKPRPALHARGRLQRSGSRPSIVMTLANRAIGAPINIWNDHSDAMAVRDSGWIQLFAETNQEASDLHIQAFRLAEELSVPVMVCMDGFILTTRSRASTYPSSPSWTPFSRRMSRARCSTPPIRSRSGPWSDRRPSRRSLPRAPPPTRRSRADPQPR